jgi:two-component SAPR family response regulator
LKISVVQRLLFIVLFSVHSLSTAQEYASLADSLKLEIRNSSHILLHLDSIPLSEVKTIVQKNTLLAFYLSSKNVINKSFLQEFGKRQNRLIIISEQEIEEELYKNASILYIRPKDIESIKLTADTTANELVRFSGLQELGKVSYREDFSASDSLFLGLWRRSGKPPTFIETNRKNLLEVDSLVTYLNSLRKIFGVVKAEDELLSEVSFQNMNGLKVNGYFSYPLLKGEGLPILIPHKTGYNFSPDVIFASPENRNNNKIFSAIQLDLDFGLTDHFVFHSGLSNNIRKNDDQLLLNNIEFERDPVHGNVGYFNHRAYVDAGIDSKSSLQESFTISAWIKPTEFSFNNSILGKGKSFVLKLHDGFLTFTMADIKDYVSRTSAVQLNEWTHIALVHSKIDKEMLFYINGEETETIQLISDYVISDNNLLIGSNLWEEFFIGYLNDIKIWDRELNGKEIATLFAVGTINLRFFQFEIDYGIIALIVLLIILMIILWKRRLRSRKDTFDKIFKDYSQIDEFEKLERILCFGKLRILDKSGTDIATKFSPLLKKIFVLVFLYSVQGDKKGISTKKLTEFLWAGMTLQGAKNTRGTNINNLRSILEACSGIQLVFKDKCWFMEISEQTYCDFILIQNYLNAFSHEAYTLKELEGTIPQFLKILKKGRLYSSSSDAWLDPFIEKFSNQIIDQCVLFTQQLDINHYGDLIFSLAEVICIYDDLNEKAHQLKLQILIQQGKLSLAHTTYDNFVKLYDSIYKESYPVSFETIISNQTLDNS